MNKLKLYRDPVINYIFFSLMFVIINYLLFVIISSPDFSTQPIMYIIIICVAYLFILINLYSCITGVITVSNDTITIWKIRKYKINVKEVKNIYVRSNKINIVLKDKKYLFRGYFGSKKEYKTILKKTQNIVINIKEFLGDNYSGK